MADERDLEPLEYAALKQMLTLDVASIENHALANALLERGLIRREGMGWCVTLTGHLRYLRELSARTTF